MKRIYFVWFLFVFLFASCTPKKPTSPLDFNSPLPQGPIGEMISAELGPVTLETYNPVTITWLENSTNLYFYAHNTGDSQVTVLGPRAFDVPVNVVTFPSRESPKHFFELNPFPTPIVPGDTALFEFMLTRGGDVEEVDMDFTFTLVETGEQTTLTVKVISTPPPGPETEALPETALIRGAVTVPGGAPLRNAQVTAFLFNDMREWRAITDSKGQFYILVPSLDVLQAALGDRPLPYSSLGYTLTAEAEGYTLGYSDQIEPARGAEIPMDFTLQPVSSREYVLSGELSTDGVYGYWWLLPRPDFDSLIAVQGRHPPELNVPGHIIAVSLTGEELWRVPTQVECWGFDVSTNGEIAAGCHDGTVYLLSPDGELRWQFDSGGMNRWVQFSPDGSVLLTGPGDGKDIVLLDVVNGKPLWSFGSNLGWLRNAVWSPDGERVLTGYSGGILAMLTREGQSLWEGSIGEFPMVFEMDADYNSYMAGKIRELFSFDANGNLRWRSRIGTHSVTAGADNMSAAGDLIAMGTGSGWLLVFDNEGNLLWQRRIHGNLQGHNALDMTPDGQFIVVGSAGEVGNDGFVSLYNRNGALLWQTQYPDRRDLGIVTSPYAYDHNQRGAITIAISDDGRYIAAGFGDSTIRIFEFTP